MGRATTTTTTTNNLDSEQLWPLVFVQLPSECAVHGFLYFDQTANFSQSSRIGCKEHVSLLIATVRVCFIHIQSNHAEQHAVKNVGDYGMLLG